MAALRAEVASAREELAALKAAPKEAGPVVPAVIEAPGAAASETTASVPAEPVAITEIGDASDAADAPRWGRPSSTAAAQQAIRERGSRPRWLPPWLPFVIVVLAAVGFVAANVDAVGGARSLVGGALLSPSPTRDVIVVTFAPTGVGSPASPSGLTVAAATSIATSLAVAAGSLPQSAPSQTPSRAPALTVNGAQATKVSTSTPMPGVTPTPAPTRPPTLLPPARAPLTAPVAPPDALGPEGPIVAAYTAYSAYSVKPGDTLNRVATEFGVTGESIVRASGLGDPNLLLPGQVLTIPRDSGWLYRVQPNDTLEQIATRFGVSADDLFTASRLSSSIVYAGDLLFIPNRAVPAPK